jgi:hypothetical protein
MGIRRIRRAVRQVRYEFTSHALDEMDDDGLTEEDVCAVLLRGSLVEELTDDPRGVRFVICGSPKLSVVQVEVVCRFLPSGLMRIITAYVLEG